MPQESSSDLLARGELNRLLGWTLVLAALVAAVWLDPWSLAESNKEVWSNSPHALARHAQAVLFGMGFFQLAAGRIFSSVPALVPTRVAPSLVCGGTIAYCAAYVAGVVWPTAHWLAPLGAAANLVGLSIWLRSARRKGVGMFLTLMVLTLCFGMLLDISMGLFASSPDSLRPKYLGPLDGVRLRMLRLARAAVIALSLLTLLYQDLIRDEDRYWRWCGWILQAGAVGMPVLLVATALTVVSLKYLLGLPAQAALLGVLAAVWLASRRSSLGEVWGWTVVAASMFAGMFMGLYAFEGPLTAPSFLGEYNDWNRRLLRLAHAYLIVLGTVCILQSRLVHGRATDQRPRPLQWYQRAGLALLCISTLLTPILIWMVPARDLPITFLWPGPATAAVGILLCTRLGSDMSLC